MKTQTVKTEWNIRELEEFFNENKLPAPPIRLNQVCNITNVAGFVKSHLEIVKTNFERPTFEPYLFRLQQLKKWIENSKQL